ncbi:MAG TPA: hypothetical protein PK765_02175 [bacterium]|nr:hypothetical protein [bacterium]
MGTSARIDSGTEQNLQYAEIPTLVGSVPPGKGERPGNTYCSRTAVANFATHFGILAPE